MTPPTVKLGDGIIALLAHLEREYGCARLLVGDERRRAAEGIVTSGLRTLVIDIGQGRVATTNWRGGELRIHDPRETI